MYFHVFMLIFMVISYTIYSYTVHYLSTFQSAVYVVLSLYSANLSPVLRLIRSEEKCCSTLFIIIYYEGIPLFTINTQLSYRQGKYLVYVQ